MARTCIAVALRRLGVPLLLLVSLACVATTVTLKDAGDAYRDDRLREAERVLARVLRDEPANNDARVLLGFVRYRQGRHESAETILRRAVDEAPDDAEARYGLALTLRALGRPAEAREQAARAVELDPARDDLAALLDALPDSADGELPPYARPAALQMPFVAQDGFLRTAAGDPIPVRGVNLGIARPGRFPSEFPRDRATYDRWLEQIGDLGANVVRVYTIHTPAFYESLRDHNLSHPDRPLLLIHGVWAELPEDHDYRGDYEDAFLEEARRVVDLLHGQARIEPRRGHASGTYTADVSAWLLGLLIGREWEPFSVDAFNATAPGETDHPGAYIAAASVTPMEAWLARVMDRVAAYHAERYNQQTPMAFSSWPTLDPLHHPTETSWREEVPFRRAQGEDIRVGKGVAFDEDDAQVDAALVRATEDFAAGTFAAYHVYPYYPDFLVLDPGYGAHPRSRYYAYLEELKRHHGAQPVLVAEFGVPSSRGRSHRAPDGRHHGGLDEADQARITVELYREITDAGMAGGVVFAWIDEWFKTNWLWHGLQRPAERNRTWHNVMNPEQCFGLVAWDPVPSTILGGESPPLDEIARSGAASLRARADAQYLHVALRGGGPGPHELRLDVHPAEGDEIRVTLESGTSRLQINDGYRFFREVHPGRPWAYLDLDSAAYPRPGAPWASWITQVNRRRFGRDGTEYPRVLDEPGLLREGADPADPAGGRSTLADYLLLEDGFQVRLPWTLVGVTDPGARRVFDGRVAGKAIVVEDIGVRVLSSGSEVVGRFTWEPWDLSPATEPRLKPAYRSLRALWSANADASE